MLSIGSKKYRNLQEQVGYNTEQIEEIQAYLDGISLDDKLVVIPSTSGNLTDEEYDVVAKKLAFMATSSAVYIKSEENVSDIVFRQVKLVATAIGTTNFEIGTNKITISKLTKAYVGSTDSVLAVYSKDQVDTLLLAKTDKTYVDTELAKKADLTGANFSGPIEAPEIIELMNGYNFIPSSKTNMTLTLIYVGACKTGNKLTLVAFGTFSRSDDIANDFAPIGRFVIPKEVGNKIIPTPLGAITNAVMSAKIPFFNAPSASNDSNTILSKGTEDSTHDNLTVYIYGVNSKTVNVTYQFRYEVTFLLSDNLAS